MSGAQVAADLRAAADVLRRDGWTQEAYHRETDEGHYCHCVVGSLEVATGAWSPTRSVKWDWPRIHSAWNALDRVVGGDTFDWNDTPGRTADEVIAALEAAADAAEATS